MQREGGSGDTRLEWRAKCNVDGADKTARAAGCSTQKCMLSNAARARKLRSQASARTLRSLPGGDHFPGACYPISRNKSPLSGARSWAVHLNDHKANQRALLFILVDPAEDKLIVSTHMLSLVDLGNLEHLGVDILERIDTRLERPVLCRKPGYQVRKRCAAASETAVHRIKETNVLGDAVGANVAKALAAELVIGTMWDGDGWVWRLRRRQRRRDVCVRPTCGCLYTILPQYTRPQPPSTFQKSSPSRLDGIAEVLVEGRDVDGGEARGKVLPGLHCEGLLWMSDG